MAKPLRPGTPIPDRAPPREAGSARSRPTPPRNLQSSSFPELRCGWWTRIALLTALLLTVAGITPVPSLADATPMATPSGEETSTGAVAAQGLTNPRGITFDPDGTLLVALAGVGGDNPGTVEAPVVIAVGTLFGGKTASVVAIENSCPVTIAPNLPSTRDEGGITVGAAAIAFLDEQLYVLIGGGGVVHGNPDMSNGVYRVEDNGDVTLIADFSAWIRANPVESPGGPADYSPDGDPFGMVADPAEGVLWVTEANSGQLLRVELDGTITRLADFSDENLVPTALALAPEGGVYVGFLTPVPFVDGTSRVVHITPDGTQTDVWTGLTMLSSVAVGPDGSLYALEMSTGNSVEPPFLNFDSGRLLKQTGPDSAAEVAVGLPLPPAMAFGPDGQLYLVFPGIGATEGQGMVIRFAPDPDDVITLNDFDLAAMPACAPVAATPVS